MLKILRLPNVCSSLAASITLNFPMRMPRHLQLPRNIILRSRLHHRNKPALVLYKSIHRQIRAYIPAEPRKSVALRSAAGQCLNAGLYFAKAHRDIRYGRKVVRAPALIRAVVAPGLVPKQNTFIGIGITILIIPVEEPRPEIKLREQLRGCCFRAQVQLRDTWHMREINSWIERCPARIRQR